MNKVFKNFYIDDLQELDPQDLELSARILYGLIHQRFILVRQGMEMMVI